MIYITGSEIIFVFKLESTANAEKVPKRRNSRFVQRNGSRLFSATALKFRVEMAPTRISNKVASACISSEMASARISSEVTPAAPLHDLNKYGGKYY